MNGSVNIQSERRLFQGVSIERLKSFGAESLDLLSDTPYATIAIDFIGNEEAAPHKKRTLAQMALNAGSACGFGAGLIARAKTNGKYIDVENSKVEEIFTVKCGMVIYGGWFKPRAMTVGAYTRSISRKIREDFKSEAKIREFKERNFPWKPWENERFNGDINLTVDWEWSDGIIPHPHLKPKFGGLAVNTLEYNGKEYGCTDVDLIFNGENIMVFGDLKASGQTARPAQKMALEKLAKYASLNQGFGAAVIASHDTPVNEEIDAADARIEEFEIYRDGKLTDETVERGTPLYEALKGLSKKPQFKERAS